MKDNIVALIFSISAALSGIILGWLGKSRTVRQDVAADATRSATLQTELGHIKRGIDDLRIDIKLQSQKYDSLAETVIRHDESMRSIRSRLDKLEDAR